MHAVVTGDDLQTKCALTTDASTVAELRQWVSSGGDFTSESGKRLKLKLDTQVRGRPFHSHAAERLVGLGVRLHRKHGGHETDQHFSTRVTSKSNNTAEDVRNAACAFERKQKKEADEEKGRAGAQAPWVDDQAAERRKRGSAPRRRLTATRKCLGWRWRISRSVHRKPQASPKPHMSMRVQRVLLGWISQAGIRRGRGTSTRAW